jgi:alpha-1,2-mannosyltransferase
MRAKRFLLIVALLVVAAAAHVWYGNRHHFADLGIYRDAMIWWRGGHPLYDFVRPDPTQGSLQFTYPPFAALLLAPTAWMSWGATIWAFVALALALFALMIWWLAAPLAERHGQPRWFVFLAAGLLATGLEPVRDAFTFGQINFLLWALVLLDLLVLWPRGSRWTGVGIGLATAIKLVPGIFIVYLLVARRWRAAAVAAGTAVVVTGLTAAVLPKTSWRFFTAELLHPEGVGRFDYTFNQSLFGVLARAGGGEANRVAWAVGCLVIAGYGLWRAARAASLGDEVAGLTLAGIVGSLISPVTWGHHVFWFVPALIVLADRAWRSPAEPEVVSGVSGRLPAGLLAAFVYVTATVSILAVWQDVLGQPEGAAGVVMRNWFVWLMLLLLPTLPIRRLAPTPALAPIKTARS